MKKYMIMSMAVLALLFASCKNEDISISREVSFEVNPYEVINKFVNNEVFMRSPPFPKAQGVSLAASSL